MSKILILKTILTKNIFKKKDKTDGCMRRLQQVSNINIINTKLITVTDINDKFWPFEWKEQKIVSYIIRFDWFCSTCLFINSFILLEVFFLLKCSFILQSKLLSNSVPNRSCRFVDLYRRKPIRRLALAYWPWDTHWFCFLWICITLNERDKLSCRY